MCLIPYFIPILLIRSEKKLIYNIRARRKKQQQEEASVM